MADPKISVWEGVCGGVVSVGDKIHQDLAREWRGGGGEWVCVGCNVNQEFWGTWSPYYSNFFFRMFSDTISNTAVAKLGYPGMATGAAFGEPLLNHLFALGIAMTINTIRAAPENFMMPRNGNILFCASKYNNYYEDGSEIIIKYGISNFGTFKIG